MQSRLRKSLARVFVAGLLTMLLLASATGFAMVISAPPTALELRSQNALPDVDPRVDFGSCLNSSIYRESRCAAFGVGKVPGCTATPISRTVVLSAAHCFVNGQRTKFWIPGVMNSIYGTAHNHPSYTGAVVSNFDIAVVVLDSPLPEVIPHYRLSAAAAPIGAVIVTAGYGCAIQGGGGYVYETMAECSWFNAFNISFNTIDRVGYYGQDKVLMTDYDSVGVNRFGGGPLSQPGGKVGQTINYEGTTARGDSGGPSFYNFFVDAAWRDYSGVSIKLKPKYYEIVAVTSFGSDTNYNNRYSDYGDLSGFTPVAPHLTWLQSFTTVSTGVGAGEAIVDPNSSIEPPGLVANEIPDEEFPALAPDADGDLLTDSFDNCPETANPDQKDTNGNGIGDLCDADTLNIFKDGFEG